MHHAMSGGVAVPPTLLVRHMNGDGVEQDDDEMGMGDLDEMTVRVETNACFKVGRGV